VQEFSNRAPNVINNCESRTRDPPQGSAQQIDLPVPTAHLQSVPALYRFEAGGFGSAPTIVLAHPWHNFSCAYSKDPGNPGWREGVETFIAMERGGRNDQRGGAISTALLWWTRYWFVTTSKEVIRPGRQLVISYLEAFQITQEPTLAKAAGAAVT